MLKVISLILFSLAAFASDNHLLLELNRVDTQYNKIIETYKFLDDKIDLPDNIDSTHLAEDLVDQLEKEILSSPKLHRHPHKGLIKRLFNDVRDEVRSISRNYGAALGIIIAIVEITEIPIKLLAVGAGAPQVLLIYEAIQPAITLPALTFAVQKMIKNMKLKKRIVNSENFKRFKSYRKKADKKFGSNKVLISSVQDTNYIIHSSNFLKDFIQFMGFKKNQLNFKNLKRIIRKNKIDSEKINLIIKQKAIPKQLRAKMILTHLNKVYIQRFMQKNTLHSKLKTPAPILKWTFNLMKTKSKEGLCKVLADTPKTGSPLLITELWSRQIKDVLFEKKGILPFKVYRKLYRATLEFHLDMQAQAINDSLWPKWTEKTEKKFNKAFIKSINCPI